MEGDWANPWPMIGGWLLLVAGFVFAVALLVASVRSATEVDDDSGSS